MKSILSRSSLAALTLGALVLAAGCNKKEETVSNSQSSSTSASTTTPQSSGMDTTAKPEAASQPAGPALPAGHIEVQHVLIGFAGTIPGKNVTRSQAEAQTLANQILDRAKKGEDFGQLVQKYTDDQYPGIYQMADNGVAPSGPNEASRDHMVKGFGDAAFSLKIGEVGISNYDPTTSPYGWHIIKRLR